MARGLGAKYIRKTFKHIVMEEANEVKSWYVFIQAQFSPKSRTRIYKRMTNKIAIYSAVGTEKASPLLWLGAGTNVRYKRMQFGFVGKTSPGSGLSFRQGAGGASGWGLSPGIKPRNFRDAIIKKRLPEFYANAERGFDVMLKGAGWI